MHWHAAPSCTALASFNSMRYKGRDSASEIIRKLASIRSGATTVVAPLSVGSMTTKERMNPTSGVSITASQAGEDSQTNRAPFGLPQARPTCVSQGKVAGGTEGGSSAHQPGPQRPRPPLNGARSCPHLTGISALAASSSLGGVLFTGPHLGRIPAHGGRAGVGTPGMRCGWVIPVKLKSSTGVT
jgi:hypothetical protein